MQWTKKNPIINSSSLLWYSFTFHIYSPIFTFTVHISSLAPLCHVCKASKMNILIIRIIVCLHFFLVSLYKIKVLHTQSHSKVWFDRQTVCSARSLCVQSSLHYYQGSSWASQPYSQTASILKNFSFSLSSQYIEKHYNFLFILHAWLQNENPSFFQNFDNKSDW